MSEEASITVDGQQILLQDYWVLVCESELQRESATETETAQAPTPPKPSKAK